jgi:hypothetical protein
MDSGHGAQTARAQAVAGDEGVSVHPDQEGGLGFSYQETKGGTVFIRRLGRVVTRLRHSAARDFLAEVEGASPADAQETMARTTGNYKRGNERRAAEHPRRQGSRGA